MRRLVVGLVLLTVWTGCGSDGTESSSDSEPAMPSAPVAAVESTDLDPRISPVGPQGSVPQTIVIELARPVVEGHRVGEAAEGFEITSDPPIEGTAKFTSPSTIAFQPASPLLPGVEYRIQIAQVPTDSGDLEPPSKEAWSQTVAVPSFEFLRMALEGVDYRRGQLDLKLLFSAAADLPSVRDRIRFVSLDDQGRESPIYVSRVSGGETEREVLVRLRRNGLQSGSRVRLQLKEGAHYLDREDAAAGAHDAELILPKGDPVVQVRDLFPIEGSGGFLVEVVCDDGAVEDSRYYYNQTTGRGFGRLSRRCQLDEDSIDKVRIEPEVPFTIAPAGGGFRIFGAFERGAYSVRIDAGARTVDGGEFRTEYEKAFSVPALSPMLSFVSQGRYLPRSVWDSLPVRHRNLGEIEASVRQVPPDNLVYWMSDPDSEAATLRTSDLVAQHRYTVPGPADATVTSHLDVASLVAPETKGLLELTLRNGEATAAARIVLTDLQLIAKRSATDTEHPWGRSVLAWAFDAHSLEPQSGVRVRLVRQSGKVVVEGMTRADGSVRLTLPAPGLDPAPPFALLATRGSDLTYLEFEDLRTEVQETRVAGEPYRSDKKYRVALYGDRGVYRPGETAHLAGVVRDENLVAPTAGMPVLLRLLDPRGQVSREDLVTTNAAGMITLDTPFADFADTGSWTLEALVGDVSLATQEFLVEEFIPERLEVEAGLERSDTLLGESIPVHVEARYLFGGVPAGHQVELTCELEPGSFEAPDYPSYTFAVWHPDGEAPRPIDLGRATGTLDSDGAGALSCPAPDRAGGFEGAGRVTARAAVFESGSGRTTVGRAVGAVHPAPYYLGLQSGTDAAGPGEAVRIEGVVVDWVGERRTDLDTVSVELIRLEEEWGYYYDENLGYENYQRYLRPVPEEQREVAVVDGKFTVDWTPQNHANSFLVRASHGKAKTELQLAGRGGWYYWSPQQNHQQRTPRPDRPTWIELGAPDTARVDEAIAVRFNAPYGGRALLTVETDEVLTSEWRTVEAGEVNWTFRLRDFTPNVYVTALVVKDPHLDTEEAFLPDRSFGVASIDLEPVTLKQEIALNAPEEVRAGSRLELDLDLGPLTAPTWVTVAAVDEGILSLTGFDSPNPLREILARRALGVDTFETVGWSLVVPPGSPTSTTGGDLGTTLGRVQPVDPVALWSGPVAVPDDGRTTVAFDLPQYQGSLRVMVVSASKERIGRADQRVTVRDPLVLQTTLPRFLAPKDTAYVPVFVTNLSGQRREILVSLEAESLAVGGGLSELPSQPVVRVLGLDRKALTLGDGEQGQALFQLASGSGLGAVSLTARIESGDLSSQDKGSLVVQAVEPESRVNQRIPLETGTTDLSPYLEGWQPMSERSTFWVTNNPYGDAFDHLAWLVRYPYGCIEQTISSTRPLLALPRLLQRVDPELVEPDSIDAMVQSGIDRLFSMQTPEGGFSYWPGSNDPVHWGTANAVHLLLDAQEARYSVPQRRIDRAVAWMERQITHHYERGAENGHYRSQGAEPYLHFVLAKAGKARKGRILQLIDGIGKPEDGQEREQLFMLQAALYMAGDQRYESDLRDPDVSNVTWDRRQGWNFYSDRRRRGFMLATMVDLFGRTPDAAPLANLVAESLRGRASSRFTTQEVVWSTTGLGRYLDPRPADFAVPVLRVGGRVVAPDHLPPPEPATDGSNAAPRPPTSERTWSVYRASEYEEVTVEVPSKGDGNVYLMLSSQGVRVPSDTKYGDQGLHLERRYLDPEGNPLSNHPTVGLGDVVYVELQLRNDTPERISNLALVDRVPAGWEIENPRLGRDGTVDWFDTDSTWEVAHLNLRDDRIEVFGDLEPREVRRVLYAVRAVTAGRFTLPPADVEAMYDPEIWSRVRGGPVVVESPWD